MRPDFPTYFQCWWFISTKHREKQLLGTRERSLWHLWFFLMAILRRGLMQHYCNIAVHQSVYLDHSKAPGEDPATGFSCDLKCEILIGTQADFGREFYSPTLHRTELCGISPNTTSECNPSQPSPRIHDYPGNKRPLNRHNLFPMNPS